MIEDDLRHAEVERPEQDRRQRASARRSSVGGIARRYRRVVARRLEAERAWSCASTRPGQSRFAARARRARVRNAADRDLRTASAVPALLLGEVRSMPTTSVGRRASTIPRQGVVSDARKSSARFRPRELVRRAVPCRSPSMNTSGHQFATNTCSKNRSALPEAIARPAPEPRPAHLRTSAVEAPRPVAVVLASAASRPAPSRPTKSRTITTSPNGTPVCAIAERPRVHADHHDISRGDVDPQRSRYASCGRTCIRERGCSTSRPTGTEARRPALTARG